VQGGATANGSVGSYDWRTGRMVNPEVRVQSTAMHVTGPSLDVVGDVDASGKVDDWEPAEHKARAFEGRAKIRSHVETGQAPAKDFAGDFQANLQARSRDGGGEGGSGTIDVSGSNVAMRNVSVGGIAAPESRGDLLLQGATLRLDNPELAGALTLDVNDATSLLVGVRSGVPFPFRGLLDIPRLQATARLSANERRVELDDVDARGGRLAVDGMLAQSGHDRLGAFIVQGGPFSVGVALDPKGAHVRLFGLSGWLVEQKAEIARRFGGAGR
jgi:hypothetical protein